ncbi:MAG: ABC transporter substrate-binding protein [Myxococcales bacterium]|nr:ABC transporter substrate-binding protein [Myxococcales bacterium]
MPSSPSKTEAVPAALGPALRALIGLLLQGLMLVLASSGCPGGTGPAIGGVPSITSNDPEAEREMEAARRLEETGKREEARAAYESFVETRQSDPLAPLASLALGRLLLGDDKPEQAASVLEPITQHRDSATAEQASFYLAVARQQLGDHKGAVSTLTPMMGRTVDASDTSLLLRTLANAHSALGHHDRAVIILDTLVAEPVSGADQRWARQRLAAIIESEATPAQIETLHRELPRDGVAWPLALRKALIDADAAGDAERTRTLLEVARDHGLSLDDALSSIAMRADRPRAADPRVIGAVLSLSGRARKVGELALRGIMLAAGLPPKGPQGPDHPRVIFRDDGGDPARAVEAINELVAVHRVIAIIGPMDGRVAEAATARAQELEVPMVVLSPSGDPTRAGSMIHRYIPTPALELRELVEHARDSGRPRIAALLPEGAYGDLIVAALRQEVAHAGAHVAADVRYPAGSTSFGQPIAQLEEQPFDALLVADTARTTALIAPALAAAGLWSTAAGQKPSGNGRGIGLLAPAVSFDHDLSRSVGRYLQGAVFAVPFDAETADGPGRQFSERFETQFSSKPDAFAAFSHDAYKLLRTTIDAGAQSRQELAERLWRVRGSDLAGPSRGFTESREARRGARLLTLEGDHFVRVAHKAGK